MDTDTLTDTMQYGYFIKSRIRVHLGIRKTLYIDVCVMINKNNDDNIPLLVLL